MSGNGGQSKSRGSDDLLQKKSFDYAGIICPVMLTEDSRVMIHCKTRNPNPSRSLPVMNVMMPLDKATGEDVITHA